MSGETPSDTRDVFPIETAQSISEFSSHAIGKFDVFMKRTVCILLQFCSLQKIQLECMLEFLPSMEGTKLKLN